VDFLRIPLAEGVLTFFVLDLLGNDCGWTTGIEGERDTVLTDMGC